MEGSNFVKNLKDYEVAIAEEFASDVTDLDKVKELTYKLFVEEIPALAKQLRYISTHADKESDQIAAIKFVFEFIFGKVGAKGGAEGGLDALIKQLQDND